MYVKIPILASCYGQCRGVIIIKKSDFETKTEEYMVPVSEQ